MDKKNEDIARKEFEQCFKEIIDILKNIKNSL